MVFFDFQITRFHHPRAQWYTRTSACAAHNILFIETCIAVWIEKRQTSGRQKNTEKCVGESFIGSLSYDGELFMYYYYVHLYVTAKIYVPTYNLRADIIILVRLYTN